VINCENKRRATTSDLKPGMIVHTNDCSVSIMAITSTPVNEEGTEKIMDWSTGEVLAVYPSMVYIHDSKGVSTKSGFYAVLSSSYHLAEVQRLEYPGETE